MNQFRLSTGILSPIHSDTSLNDTSALSFGCLSGIPDFEKETESSEYEAVENDSNIDSVCKRTMKESAAAFDVIVNDIKKQSNINAEKEERFKESYEIIKHSMDELFYKVSHSSVLSPVSNNADLENVNQAENIPSEIKTNMVTDVSQNALKTGSTKLKTQSQVSSRKCGKKEASGSLSSRKKEDNQQSKNIHSTKDSKQSSKYKSKVQLENEIDAKKDNSLFGLQKTITSKIVSTATQTCEQFEAAGAKGKENLKNFYSQKQRKVAVPISMPATETKSLSIEKSIQTAVGMEMDNLRHFMLEQNLCLRKELLKLQATAKKQNEVTGYLFSVIEELMKENKKLISKHK